MKVAIGINKYKGPIAISRLEMNNIVARMIADAIKPMIITSNPNRMSLMYQRRIMFLDPFDAILPCFV